MKVNAVKEHEPFKPVNVTFSFESLEEVEAFYNIFNYSPLARYMTVLDFGAIRTAISNVCDMKRSEIDNKQLHEDIIATLKALEHI